MGNTESEMYDIWCYYSISLAINRGQMLCIGSIPKSQVFNIEGVALHEGLELWFSSQGWLACLLSHFWRVFFFFFIRDYSQAVSLAILTHSSLSC